MFKIQHNVFDIIGIPCWNLPWQCGMYPKSIFPRGRNVMIMNAVVKQADIDIEYGTEVASLAVDGTPCVQLSDGSTRCAK